MRILYLYAELMDYNVAVLRVLVQSYGAEVHVVCSDHMKLTPYVAPAIEGVSYYGRSNMDRANLMTLIGQIKPDLAVISGWQDSGYLPVARQLVKEGVPVVAGFDDQWDGSFRQLLANLFGAGLVRKHFTHAWVTGAPQFEYARRLGFPKERIVFDCYSADLGRFNAAFEASQPHKAREYPHKFLFVGRFTEVKGTDLLLREWNELGRLREDWGLSLIGSGDLVLHPSHLAGCTVKAFLHPSELIKEVPCHGCFILPSRREPWGVVIHEFAAAGLPILCSRRCGAAASFVVPGYNGFTFDSENIKELRMALLRIIRSTDSQLLEMAMRSHHMAQRITPESSAANLVSVVV